MTRHFGAVFVLASMQRAEACSAYETDAHATDAMAAEEQIHVDVVPGQGQVFGSGMWVLTGGQDCV